VSNAKLNIAIACFPTFGGSGVVATELALAMAARGHCVHVFARDVPVRLHAHTQAHSQAVCRGVKFHEVADADAANGALPSNAYPIALAAKLVEVATYERVDVIHAHYAAPHATSAWMARSVLAAAATGGAMGAATVGATVGATGAAVVPRVVTTLHGTDVTAVDASHFAVTRHAVTHSDAVTAPSAFLRREARAVFGASLAVDVIPNFVDTAHYAPIARTRATGDELVLAHVSNFRKVKRVHDVIAVFAAVAKQRAPGTTRLVLVGDGPERSSAERRVRELGLTAQASFVGKQEEFVDVLAAADVFLLPSASESFGLAALEAMSCGVPVVGSDVGGLPEVIEHGVSGFLAPVGDVDAMAAHVLTLADASTWSAFSHAARARSLARFQRDPAVDLYEALYERVTQHTRETQENT
jgi:N-acetyl-alpha-D-glucosaminyl L-malate synthase BshA